MVHARHRHYLDMNATAPLRPEARDAFVRALDEVGNPSSIHTEGRRARALVEKARTEVAGLVNAKPQEVIFTSGATEANAWALSGVLSGLFTTVLVSAVEHPSVLLPARQFAAIKGARVETIDVDALGLVTLEELSAPHGERSLMALQLASNETGVIQDVARAALLGIERGFDVHTDAVQAAGRIPVDFRALNVVTLSLSSHKLGGPKGIGALVVRDGYELPPLLTGGGQEMRRRAGTENVAAIAGFGAAAAAALRDLAAMDEVARRRDAFEADVMSKAPGTIVVAKDAPRLPNTSCLANPGRDAETMMIRFDLEGFAVSSGAACSSGKVGKSHVLEAMGLPAEIVRGAIRVSTNIGTSQQDLAAFAELWGKVSATKPMAA